MNQCLDLGRCMLRRSVKFFGLTLLLVFIDLKYNFEQSIFNTKYDGEISNDSTQMYWSLHKNTTTNSYVCLYEYGNRIIKSC